MVAKISIGTSLYGALAYNGEKINEEKGRLLATSRIFDDGTGHLDIRQAFRDFSMCMPENVRTRNKVIHISLNPHPDDLLDDGALTALATEYLDKLGYGNQPYAVFKHEDIDRHHLHIVSLNVDENGKRLNKDYLFRRSKRITREMEQAYGLHTAERRRLSEDEPLHRVDASEGSVKKQVTAVLKGITGKYACQTLGEYRALLSLYNVTVEECGGEVGGRAFHGFVYSATDNEGNKVGNPFKSSLFGKRYGYEAFQKHTAESKERLRNDRRPAAMTKRSVLSVLAHTHRRDCFVELLRQKGIDVVIRETDEGRIYGVTFIDHRTHCVLNGSRLGKELSANALQEHFSHPERAETAGQQQIPRNDGTVWEKPEADTSFDSLSDGLGLFESTNPATDPEEEAFRRRMQRKRKKRGGPKL